MIIEVENGFISKEYDDNGNIIGQSEVFATKEEAEAAEVAPLDKQPKEGIGQATPEAMVDPELSARTQSEVSESVSTEQEGEQANATTPSENTEEAPAATDQVDPEPEVEN